MRNRVSHRFIRSAALRCVATTIAVGLLLFAAHVGYAGGPLILFDAGTRTPLAYPPGTVSVYTDLGALGVLSNSEADSLVQIALAEWTAVSSSYFSAAIAGEILVGGVPTDITLANVDSIITTQFNTAFNGGGIHIIYDTDGSILTDFFGAPPGVGGVASPEFSDTGVKDLLESWVVVNGAQTSPSDTSPFPGAYFGGIVTHEFGHSINLAHTKTNGAIIFFGDDNGASGCSPLGGTLSLSHIETMYPFIDITPGSGSGREQATVEHLDDVAALSDIYPPGSWPGSLGTITGTIFLPDGVTEVTGVNVIARNLADPLGDANSALSGDYTQGSLGPDGLFTLNGLTPGAEYVIHVDAIANGADRFSTTPTEVVFFEEYWNGPNESGDLDADTACVFVPITAVAGAPATADIILNAEPIDTSTTILPLGNIGGIPVALPFSFPFCGALYDTAWVDADGFLTFGQEDISTSISPTSLLNGPPRITGIWSDLAPGDGGTVSTSVVGGNFVVTYTEVPEYFWGGLNTFSITLRPDGTHKLTTFALGSVIALVGRSPGGGAPNPGPTDISTAPQPLGTWPGNETVYESYTFSLDIANYTMEFDPCGEVIGVGDPIQPPTTIALQSRPNPFRSSTVITFELPRSGPVQLRVFDLHGRLMRTIEDGPLDAGRYRAVWGGTDSGGRPVAPGVYFYRLDAPSLQAARKVIRVR